MDECAPDWLFGDPLPVTLAVDAVPPPGVPAPLPKVVVYGDSYTGNETGRGPDGWLARIADELPVETVNMAVPGAGYVRCMNSSTFPYAATVHPVPDAAVVIVMGSQNDREQDPAAAGLAATVAYAAIRVGCPAARLLIVGGHWPWPSDPSANALAVQAAVAGVCADQGLTFLDPIAGQWLTSRPGLIDGTGSHPNAAGHQVIADHVRPELAALLP